MLKNRIFSFFSKIDIKIKINKTMYTEGENIEGEVYIQNNKNETINIKDVSVYLDIHKWNGTGEIMPKINNFTHVKIPLNKSVSSGQHISIPFSLQVLPTFPRAIDLQSVDASLVDDYRGEYSVLYAGIEFNKQRKLTMDRGIVLVLNNKGPTW